MGLYVLGLLSAIFSFKALGGSFHALMARMGLVQYHGPLMGSLICALMAVFFLCGALSSEASRESSHFPRPKGRALVLAAFLVLVGFGIKVRIDKFHSLPIEVTRADMLPNVLAGLEDARHGISPYHPHRLSDGRVLPHYYPPTLWMGYFPFYLLGLDIRYYNLISQLVVCSVLGLIFFRSSQYLLPFPAASVLFLVFVGTYLFSKVALGQAVDVHTATFGLTLVLLLWSIVRNSRWPTRILIPVLLLSRETAVMMLMPYFLFLLQKDRKELLWTSVCSAAIGLAIALPFLIAPNSDLFAGPRFYANHINLSSWQDLLAYYGLGGFLKKFGLVRLQLPLQMSGLALAIWIMLSRPSGDPVRAVFLGGLSYLTFILFVSITWQYLYLEPLILIGFLWTLRGGQQPSLTFLPASGQTPSPRLT